MICRTLFSMPAKITGGQSIGCLVKAVELCFHLTIILLHLVDQGGDAGFVAKTLSLVTIAGVKSPSRCSVGRGYCR